MWEYTLSDLDRYKNMLPKANYECLEKFLRTIDDDGLFSLRKAVLEIQQGNSKPSDQIFVITVLGNLFLNEYEQKTFSKSNYLDLFPIFATSVFYEALYRYKSEIKRVDIWRELIPEQVNRYRAQHDKLKQIHE